MTLLTIKKPTVEYIRPPFTEAHITIIEGDMRSGKTCTATARVVDAYFKDCFRVYCKIKYKIDCEVKKYDKSSRMAVISYKGQKKLLRVPVDYKMWSPMPIFCNYHLFGVPFHYIPSFGIALDWIKKGTIRNAYLVLDEAYVGLSARGSMMELGRAFASTYHQFAKMQLDTIIITPMARQIDWIARTIPTEHIHCSYNSKTYKISLSIRKRGMQGEQIVEYDARQYWKYYKTGEIVTQ